nr:polyprotein [Turkana Iflavi-like virus 2]
MKNESNQNFIKQSNPNSGDERSCCLPPRIDQPKRGTGRTLRYQFSDNAYAGSNIDYVSTTSADNAGRLLDKGSNSPLTARDTVYNTNIEYTNIINIWINSHDMVYETETFRQSHIRGRRIWEFQRLLYWPEGTMIGYGVALNKKSAMILCDFSIIKAYDLIPKVQMDAGDDSKESVQGVASQESTKAGNTIITRDEGETYSATNAELKALNYCSSEQTASFPEVTGRWMPLKTINITTADTQNKIIRTYYLPETLYTEMQCSPNLLPFETFIYGRYDIIMKFVVNAHKFQCGKVLASVKFDSYQADDVSTSIQAALTRKHVILDLASNNEGTLEIPFRYHRTLLRNVKHDHMTVGVRPSKYATVTVQILSQLKTGSGGLGDMYIRPFIKLEKAEFAGMSYRVSVQMDAALTIGTDMLKKAIPTDNVREVLRTAERLIDAIGKTDNRDKPTQVGAMPTVPRPRLNFPTGKGLVDALPLRVNPYASTSYKITKPYPDDPKTMLDLARIWGLRSTTIWNSNQAEGTAILDMLVDPSVRQYDVAYTGVPTPLEYAVSMYKFWSGTIEVRLDFVSNSYHNGSVMLTAEFGRPPPLSQQSECEAASNYIKVFHLGEQRSVSMVIPYIYDTVWRRNNTTTVDTAFIVSGNENALKKHQLDIRNDSRARLRLRVINMLRPTSTVSQEVEILVFWRATPSFSLHSLKQSSMLVDRLADALPYMDNFPLDDYEPVELVYDSRTKRWKNKQYEGKQLEARNAKKDRDKSHMWNENPVVQMDAGDKEDPDTTQTFSTGLFALDLQTTDSQVSMKDILRRPTLLCHRQLIKGYSGGKTQGFFIPLMPPSRMMGYRPKHPDLIWNHLIGTTPAAMIMNLFRFWRGSMRYTIVVTGDVTEPVYVQFAPHTGTRFLGNRYVGGIDSIGSRPLAGTGLTTEMIIPRVNPTATIEVPYETENDWTLTFEEDAERNYTWRDKGDTNAGHLIISCHKDVTVDVWWSAGDDFEFANFYGIPECRQDNWVLFNDTHGRVQMSRPRVQADADFNTTDCSYWRRALGVLGKAMFPMGLTMIPHIGQALAVTHTTIQVQNVVKKMDVVTEDVRETLDEVQRTVVKVGTTADACTNLVTDLHQKLNEMTQNVLDTLKVAPTIRIIVENAIFDIVMAWMSKSWAVVGCGIVRVVYQLVGASSAVMEYGAKLASVIESLVQDRIIAQADDDHTIVGLLAALVGAAMGVSLNRKVYMSWMKQFSNIFVTSSGVSYLNQVMRFVKVTFSCIKEMIMGALGLVNPEVAALKALCTNSDLLNKFIVDAQQCMNPANASMLRIPTFRTKFWTTMVRAYQIQRAISLAPANVASPHLAKLCSEVIKSSTERFVDISCSPVRYEPFVICIEGESRIGKSHMMEKMVLGMLNKIGFNRPTANLTFVRMVGNKHWNGADNQPVVVFDDWLNTLTPEMVDQQIGELFQLKTTARFNPPMPDIESKRISMNPYIVVLLCNDAFPQMANVVRYLRAVLGRRELVLKASKKPEYADRDLRSLTSEESDTCAHLQFQMYSDVTDSKSLLPTKKSFSETMEYVNGVFEVYHRQETIQVRKRMDQLASFLHLAPGEMLGDPFELMYQAQTDISTLNQNAWLPSEQLEAAVHELVSVIERGMILDDIEIPERPPNPFEPQMLIDTTDPQVSLRCFKIYWEGIKMAPALVAKLILQSYDTMVSCMPDMTTNVYSMGYCSVCMANAVPLVVKCENSVEESEHAVCQLCYGRLQEVGRVSCPVCRSPDLYPVMSPTTDWWVKIAIWVARMGRSYIRPILNAIVTVTQMIPYRALIIVKGVITFAKFLMKPSEDTVDTMLSCGVGGLLDYLARPNSTLQQDMGNTATIMSGVFAETINAFRPMVQADWPEPEARGSTVEIPPSIEAFEFREDKWKAIDILPQRLCLHQQVIDSVGSVVYITVGERSCWKLPMDSPDGAHFVYVDDAPCKEECPFRNLDAMKTFYLNFIGRRTHNLRSLAIQFYNDLGDVSVLALGQIPKCIRPAWMEPQVRVEFKQTWWEYLTGIYEKYSTLINVCLAITSVAAGVLATTTLWERWSNPVAQADLNYNVSDVRQLRRIAVQRNPKAQYIRAQSDDLVDVVNGYILKNYVLLRIDRGAKDGIYLILTGICGKYAIMPKHYVKLLLTYMDCEMTIEPVLYMNGRLNHLRMPYKFDITSVKELVDTDLASIQLPNSYPSFKDIRKFFQTNKDLETYYPSDGYILLGPTKKRLMPMIKDLSFDGIEPRVVFDDNDHTSFIAHTVLKYDHSEKGVCGSLVLVRNHQRPIRALHVAGHQSRQIGFGVLITQELLEELSDGKIILQYEAPEYESLDTRPEVHVYDVDTRVDYLGALPKGEIPFIPKKSKIRQSNIQRYMEPPETEPAILHSSDPRYEHERTPLWYGTRKHGKNTIDFPKGMVDRAKEALWDRVITRIKPSVVKPKRLTIEEAITGIPFMEYYDPMRLDTSSGYPWQLKDPDTTKRAWCSVQRDEHGTIISCEVKSELRRVILEKEAMRRKGIVPCTIFVDTLKDERKSRAKVRREGATRVFCASPVDHTIAIRQNLLHFCAAFMRTRLEAWHAVGAVGINAKGPEWTDLFQKLAKVSVFNIVNMDYSNFGPAFNAEVAHAAAQLMIKWTMENVEGVDETELQALLMECINSVHAAGPLVYRQFAGSPSGAAITTIINTLVNLLYILISWEALAQEKALKINPDIYNVFKNYVCMVAYGDDFIMSVHDEFKDVFNTNTIRNFLSDYGITATSADKELENIPDFVSLNQATFLKRGFRKHDKRPDMVLGPLDEVSLKEIPKWVWSCSDFKLATRVNVESALMEAHGYGPTYFEKYKQELNQYLKKAKIDTVSLQWDALDAQWFKGEMPIIEPIIL